MGAHKEKENCIFISYSHQDANRVKPIIVALQKEGFSLYDSRIELDSESVETHLQECEAFLVFMSNSAAESRNCRNEIDFALDLEKDMLVIYLEETKLKRSMELQLRTTPAMYRYQYASDNDFFNKLFRMKLLENCKSKAFMEDDDVPLMFSSDFSEEQDDGVDEIYLLKSVDELQEYAKKGNVKAQHALAELYSMNGNHRLALEWYQRAERNGCRVKNGMKSCLLLIKAEEGDAQAMYEIGKMCTHSDMALAWYQDAANLGHREAQFELGSYYRSKGDNDQAIKWLEAAVMQDHVLAQFELNEINAIMNAEKKKDEQQQSSNDSWNEILSIMDRKRRK